MDEPSDDLDQLHDQAVDEFDAGRYQNALPLYEKVLQLGEAEMPLEDIIHTRETLGNCCFLLQRFDDASKYDRGTLSILESSENHGHTHKITMNVRHRLARALAATSPKHPSYTRRLEKAVSLHGQNMKAQEAGGNTEISSKTLRSLAYVLCKLSRYSEAESIYRGLLDGEPYKSRRLAEQERLNLKHEYASVLFHLQRHEDSKRLFLHLQRTLSSLAGSPTPETDLLTRSVDRYLAACVEATNDLNLGVARTMSVATRRGRSSSTLVKPGFVSEKSTTGTYALRVAQSGPSNIDQTPRQHIDSGLDAREALIRPTAHTVGPESVAKHSASGCSKGKSHIALPGRAFESLQDAPNLSLPETYTSKTRRVHSDQSIPQVGKTTREETLAPRPKSAQPSRTTENGDNRDRNHPATGTSLSSHSPRSSSTSQLQMVTAADSAEVETSANIASTRPKSNSDKKPSSHNAYRSIKKLPPSSEGRRADSPVSVHKAIVPVEGLYPDLTLGSSSGSTAQIRRTQPPALEHPSAPRDLPPPIPTIRPAEVRISSDPDLETKQATARTSSVNVGRLHGVPPNANDADTWFFWLRYHTHKLLYNGVPKNRCRKPVRVAILDSGLAHTRNDTSLPMARHWKKKIRDGYVKYQDFTGGGTAWIDNRKDLHGTWCASFVMQMASNAEFYIANVVSPKESGQKASHVASAIAWAMENEVDVISMSFGWPSYQKEVDEQIKIARTKGVLLFAAASNDSDFTPERGIYPASDATVYCIYSCRGSGTRSEFNPRSSKDKISFMFPGEDVTLLEPDHEPVKGVGRLSGTSFATPIAAGTAALVLDLVRHELVDSYEVERRLKTYEGMSDIFRAMSGDPRDDGYYHVRPWTLLGEEEPIESPHNDNETHQWYTLMHVLGYLSKRFGKYPARLK